MHALCAPQPHAMAARIISTFSLAVTVAALPWNEEPMTPYHAPCPKISEVILVVLERWGLLKLYHSRLTQITSRYSKGGNALTYTFDTVIVTNLSHSM